MDSSPKKTQDVPEHLEQKKLIEFLESLQRICKIGTYYPAGHTVLDQAAAQFQRNLAGVADTNRSVLIALRGDSLYVEEQEVSAPTNAVRDFRKLLLDLGIGTVEIDRAILLPELLQLVKSLLFGRSQLQGIKQFTGADLTGLPDSVRIRQKEFLVDECAILLDGNGEDAEHGLNTVFQVLAEQGLERNQIEQCKKFLNSLSERFSSKALNIRGLPSVTWNDVRGLLVKVVSNAYNLSDGSGGVFAQNDLNALSAIFKGLEKEVAQDKETQETINLLVSVFGSGVFNKKLLDGGADNPKGIRAADTIDVLSVGQLQSFVNDNFVHRKTLEKINMVDRREELAILLQLLQFQQEPAVESRIRQNLRDVLTSALSAREVETLIRGLMHLESCGIDSRFYDAIHSISLLLRSTKNFSSQQFLVMICNKVPPAAHARIWPILVNEILAVGRVVDQKLFDDLVVIASRLPGNEMKDRWPELEAMDCFQEKKIASDIFDPEVKTSFPLFSFLLETSMKKQIGARVLSSLMAQPPDWLIEAVAPLLQLAIPQHLKFLQTYLLYAQQKDFAVGIRVAAGTLVVHHLPEIPEEQRGEAWVAKTILATSEMQVEETRSLLERIIEEKRMVVVHKWPTSCRRSAEEALKKLKRKPL